MAAFLSCTGIGKIYENGVVALRDFSLTVEKGKTIGLIGPSACGKTTALQILAGLTNPSAGQISRNIISERIGFVFQEPALLPWADVVRNVALPLRLGKRKTKRAKEIALQALDQMDLLEFGALYPRELSGGMKMRVGLAQLLASRPELVLMDEPFAAIDEIARQKLILLFNALRRQWQWTVVLVTHNVFEAVLLCDIIKILTPRPGKVFHTMDISDPVACATPRHAQYCREILAALEAAARKN